jgi:tight adherence protein B
MTGGGGPVWVGCGLLAGAGVLVRPPHVRRAHRGHAWTRQGRRSAGLAVRWARVCRAVVRRLFSLTRQPQGPPPIPSATVLRLVDDVATQVRAGAAPGRAWTVAMSAMDAMAMPGEAPHECLDRLAAVPGAPPELLALRAAWALCEDVGAPLADVLVAVADATRQDAEVQADIESALAAPRSTARLLVLLPVAGLALGQLVGAHPLQVLLHSSMGRLCALGGLGLGLAGRWWTRRLVDRTAARL